jgi:hypothetical protein
VTQFLATGTMVVHFLTTIAALVYLILRSIRLERNLRNHIKECEEEHKKPLP